MTKRKAKKRTKMRMTMKKRVEERMKCNLCLILFTSTNPFYALLFGIILVLKSFLINCI